MVAKRAAMCSNNLGLLVVCVSQSFSLHCVITACLSSRRPGIWFAWPVARLHNNMPCASYSLLFCVGRTILLKAGLVWSDLRQHGGRMGRTHCDHHKSCCSDASYSVASTASASIDERLEHALQTNRRNDKEERRCERLRSQASFFCLISHLPNTVTNAVDFCI